MENDFLEVQYTDGNRVKRRNRRRRNTVFAVAGGMGALLLAGLLLYLALFGREGEVQVEDAAAPIEPIEEVVYTQQELDERILAAQQLAAEQAAAAKEAELLTGFKQNLESGLTVVETLRLYYPEHMVLASGGSYHFVPINDSLKKNQYDEACLEILESGELRYVEDGQVTSYKGIDVSKHQGKIDWQKVAEDGVDFAFIRVALRGYGSGKLVEDERFEENIEGALKAGIKVGVYVYSQAINEEEALEEANFVLEMIAPYEIACPVVYDVELVSGADGRMNHLTAEERTGVTALFCQTIENAGYKPMIYHNMEMGALKINLEELEEYDKWFAYYNTNFYYPYAYDVWQYSDKGRVAGIEGDVDLNISFVPIWEE